MIKNSIVHEVKKFQKGYRITFANGDCGFFNPVNKFQPFQEDVLFEYKIDRINRKNGTGTYNLIKPINYQL